MYGFSFNTYQRSVHYSKNAPMHFRPCGVESLPCIALLYLCVHDVTQQARKRVKFQRPSKYMPSHHTAAEHCTGADDDFHGDSKSPFSTLFVFLFYHLFMKRWYIETYRSSAELSRFTHTEKDISRYFKHKDVVIFLLSIEFLRWKQADRRKQISLHFINW